MRPLRLATGFAAVVVIIGLSLVQPKMAPAAGGGGDGGSGGGGGGDGGSAGPTDTTFSAALKNIDSANYSAAIPLLEKAVAADAGNADAFNYLGYSHRKLGQYKQSLSAYQKALAIDPSHRGALEYLGELYLETGRLALAEKQLGKLDDACFFGCAEYTALKKRVADYRSKRVGKVAAKPTAVRAMSLDNPEASSP